MDEDIQVNKESDDASHSSYTESDFSGDSIDGTSPAVIAQVSELLNYVYGKTSVPGRIDRVSTIMRLYDLKNLHLESSQKRSKECACIPFFLFYSIFLHHFETFLQHKHLDMLQKGF